MTSSEQQRIRALEQALQSVCDGLWETQLHDGATEFHHGFHQLTDNSPDMDASLEAWNCLLPPHDRNRLNNLMHSVMINHIRHYQIEYQIQTAAGADKYILEQGVVTETDDQEQPRKIMRMLRDRTTAQRLAQDHAANEQLIQSLFNAIPGGVAVLSPDLTVARANHVLESYAKSKLPLRGQKCHEALRSLPTPCPSCPVIKTLNTRRPEHREILLQREGQRDFWLDIYSFPIIDERQTLIGLVVYSKDITRQKLELDELIKTRKSTAIKGLTDGIAHDLNNLLYVIKGNVDLAKIKHRPWSKIDQNLTEIEKACDFARDLTQKFLLLSTDLFSVIKPIRLDPIILTYPATWIRNARVTCQTALPDQTWRVLADRDQIRRALYEVVKNAEEAMPEGGIVAVTVTNHHFPNPPRQAPAPNQKEYVKIHITDNGPGIPADRLPLIIDPYFSTKARGNTKGMGLGLAIVNAVIQRHNGWIDIQSQEGKGVAVTIFLPAA